MMVSKKKKKILSAAKIKMMEEKYGKGKAVTLSKMKEEFAGVVYVSSGSLYLDEKLGFGWPNCCMVEIVGEEQAGKTTVTLHAIANFQARFPDKYAAFVDVEHRFDPSYAAAIGVDVDNLIVSQPESAEEALDMTEDYARETDCSIVVVDSIAGLTPEEELEKPITENSVSKLPMILGRATRKLKNIVKKCETLIMFTNQWRIVRFQPFAQRGTPGGAAMKYFASIRMELKRQPTLIKTKIDGVDQNIGQTTEAYVKKNSFAPPFRKTQFNIIFGLGISMADELIDVGLQLGAIEKSGTWFSYKELKAQGKYNFLQVLQGNPKAFQEILEIAERHFFGKVIS